MSEFEGGGPYLDGLMDQINRYREICADADSCRKCVAIQKEETDALRARLGGAVELLEYKVRFPPMQATKWKAAVERFLAEEAEADGSQSVNG